MNKFSKLFGTLCLTPEILLKIIINRALIWTLIATLIAVCKFGWGPVATPSPPRATALTAVKFLPLATVKLGVYWRSAINPDFASFRAASTALGTAKCSSMNRCGSPFGRMWSKSFHVFEFLFKMLVLSCSRLSRLLATGGLTASKSWICN